MTNNLRIVHQLEEGLWRGFVETHPVGNIFHTPEMFQVFAQARRHRPGLWAAVRGDGQIMALLLPVQVAVWGGLLRFLTNRAVVYGSVLTETGPEGCAALEQLLRAYIAAGGQGAIFTELRNLSNLQHVQPILDRQGFVYEGHLNYLIPLDGSTQELLARIGTRTRKHIRQGLRRQDVVVEEITEREKIGVCLELIRKSYTAAQVPLADPSLFHAAFDVLTPKGMIKFWLARVGESPVAASIELTYKDVVYGWYGGVDRAYAQYAPGEMLTWHILEWGQKHGYRVYDFGGAGRPDEEYGVRDFKAKFGGELVCYGRNVCVHRPHLLRVSKLGYQLVRRWFHRHW